MNRLLLLLLLLLAAAGPVWAQPAATDVILRTDGAELPGRVLTITPRELRYLPAAGADTLRLAAADVFLVRYANGTREVLHPVAPPEGADLLPGLNEAERRALARRDALGSYNDHNPFWGSLGATLYGGPLLGWIAPVVMAPRPVAADKLGAPRPELLADPAYGAAYRREAQRRKRGRAWGGFGVGMAVWVVLLGAVGLGNP